LKKVILHMYLTVSNVDILPLLEAKADPNNDNGQSCLSIAVRTENTIGAAGYNRLINQLLDAKADPNVCDCGIPVLTMAARLGSPVCIQLLIDAGAVVNAVCKERQTALHAAAMSSTECCETLLRNGAYPSLAMRDSHNRTPLSRFVDAADLHSRDASAAKHRKRVILLRYAIEACGMNFYKLAY
jgi:ankyrin repeat protein